MSVFTKVSYVPAAPPAAGAAAATAPPPDGTEANFSFPTMYAQKNHLKCKQSLM